VIPARYRMAVDRDIFSNRTRMMIFKNEDGKKYRAKVEWVEDDSFNPLKDEDITFIIDNESENGKSFLTTMFDELKMYFNVKPDPTVEGLKSEVKALKSHLHDMRTLVTGFGLKMVGPEMIDRLDKVIRENQ